MTIILFLAVLAVLIFFHELGHFTVAKFFRVRVDEFAIGFPPRLFGWRRGETDYTLNVIPFGGFVKIFGEDPNEESLKGPDRHRSFTAKSRPIQAAILSAGVAANVLFAWFLFSVAIMIGVPVPGGYGTAVGDREAALIVVSVAPGSPAEKAGLLSGDVLLFLESSGEVNQNLSLSEFQAFIGRHGGEPVNILVKRATEGEVSTRTLVVTPTEGVVPERPVIGVSLSDLAILKLSPVDSLIEGARLTAYTIKDTTLGLLSFIKNAFTGSAALSDITGPIGIAGLVKEASSVSFSYLLSFTAFISVNLAVINLLPFPALDGGRLVFVIVESVIRRPIKVEIVNMLNFAGLMILLFLMAVVSYHDILRFF